MKGCMFSTLQGLMERPGLVGVVLMNDMRKTEWLQNNFSPVLPGNNTWMEKS